MKTYSDRERILGMYFGKAVGGTLGQPWEGCSGPLTLSYYDPVPKGMVPNDDLDLQVIRACLLASSWKGVLSYANMREAWVGKIDFPCDEYGVAIRNLKMGIPAPRSGIYDNAFVNGLGGAIRSELYAALAPGNPARAGRMAELDARCDHDGDGVWAEVFLAALESAAFSGAPLESLIQTGLREIPEDSKLAQGIRDTVTWSRASRDPSGVRRQILARYGSDNFTDVRMNLAFMVMALLLSEGDFGRGITLAVNCGRDTDCTGASVGAILGVLAPDRIPEKWLNPIGRQLVVSRGYHAENPPAMLEEFVDLVISLQSRVTIDDTVPAEKAYPARKLVFRKSEFHPYFILDSGKFAPRPENCTRFSVPGNLFEIDFSTLRPETLLLLETEFEIKETDPVRLLVNTPAYCRVWLDDIELFGRSGGSFVPAFHRAPLNQSRFDRITPGRHILRIGLAPVDWRMSSAPVLFGIATKNCQWLPIDFSVPEGSPIAHSEI